VCQRAARLRKDTWLAIALSPSTQADEVVPMCEKTSCEDEDKLEWRFGSVVFDEALVQLSVDGMQVQLSGRELGVLRALLRAQGRRLTKDMLAEAVWRDKGRGAVTHETVVRAVTRLRSALTGQNSGYIVTTTGQGWSFHSDQGVTHRVSDAPASAPCKLEALQPVPQRSSFTLEERLGQSAGAEVWQARGTGPVPQRVFKFAMDDVRVAYLRQELTQQRRLVRDLGQRRDLIQVHSWNMEQAPYFVECQHGGQDLERWAVQEDRLRNMNVGERVEIFLRIARTVADAHNVGVLHMNLKPGNILIAQEWWGRQVRVTDFGGSQMLDGAALKRERPAAPGRPAAGTPYLAPELRAGRCATQQSDVYALAVLLYQMLIGDFCRTFRSGWAGGMDDALCERIATAAHPDPASRTPSVQDLIEQLRMLFRTPRCEASSGAMLTGPYAYRAGPGS
jgi:non-specific serine/threonine protein kinase